MEVKCSRWWLQPTFIESKLKQRYYEKKKKNRNEKRNKGERIK